jgi:hypothetical protein
MIAVALAGLVSASAWRAKLVLDDVRWIRRADAGLRVYRPGLGWTDARQLNTRRRWARAGLVAAGLVLSAALSALRGPARGVAAVAGLLGCATILVWILRDRRLHNARYTSVCIATLACGILLYQIGVLAAGDAVDASPFAMLAGVIASVSASQLYLVAGIRKLRSPHFMSGRVLLDNLAYCTLQAAVGNRDFVRIVSPRRLPDLLRRSAFLLACRLVAILAAVVEVTIGLGVIGLLTPTLTLGLAVPASLAFLLLSPRRVLPFSAAALGLLALATTHPLLG